MCSLFIVSGKSLNQVIMSKRQRSESRENESTKNSYTRGCGAGAKSAGLEDWSQTQLDHGDTLRLAVHRQKYDRPFPYFRKPAEVGSFSQDAQRTFHNDRRQLRFFVRPAQADPGFDLRQGYASLIQKGQTAKSQNDGSIPVQDHDTVKEYLDDMLRWVIHNKAKFALHMAEATRHPDKADTNTDDSSLHTDFVCWRGLLTKLLCTPFGQQDDWQVAITKVHGTYFLCEFETEQKKQQEQQMTPLQKEMTYWGWKFEQYVTAEQEGGRPDTDRAVNNNEGFCSVVRTRLNAHSLVYGGEVDAVDSTMSGDNKYIELKTSRTMDTQRQRHNFKRFKLLKWWAQSFLLGIEKIVGGFRDDEGVVHSLQDFRTLDIPSFTQDVHNGWRANVCFNFLDQLLTFIKHSITLDHPGQVYLMQWTPGQDVQLRNVGTQSPYSFLPPWFLEWEGWRTDTTTSTTTTNTATTNTATNTASSSRNTASSS